jgi:uncharacterized delta-60 repeat protein
VRLLPGGALDASFSGDGKQTVAFNAGGGLDDRANGVALDGSGRIVLAGYAQTEYDYEFAAARLLPNGALDTAFSRDGRQTIDLGNGDDRASAVAIDARGRIVLAGDSGWVGTDHDFAVARLLDNGALDTTFSGDGREKIFFNVGGGADDRATAVALDARGRIVLGGYAQVGATDYDFAVARLLGNGAWDTAFSGDGRQTVAFNLGGGHDDRAAAVAVDAYGRIVVGGAAQAGATDRAFAAARLRRSGALDTSFSANGKTIVDFDLGGGLDDFAAGMAIDTAGHITLAGAAQEGATDYDFAVARLI